MDPIYKGISQVSEELEIAQHVLRYWEQNFPIPKIKRIKKRRFYCKKDIEILRKIKYLLRDVGYSHIGVTKILRKQQNELPQMQETNQNGQSWSVDVDV